MYILCLNLEGFIVVLPFVVVIIELLKENLATILNFKITQSKTSRGPKGTMHE